MNEKIAKQINGMGVWLVYIVVRELWKAVAVPSIMYGMNVISWNERDIMIC